MKHKIALVFPVPSLESPQKSPPLSILHVGEALKQAKARGKSDDDYEVMYHDSRYDDAEHLQEVIKWAHCVGVSSITGHQIKGAIEALKLAKQYGKRTILGGIHATMQPYQCLDEDYVDAVVMSEGEWGIIDAIHGGPKQLVQRHLKDTSEHVSPVNPSTLIHFQRSAKTGDTILLSSRGCPHACNFCFNQKFYNRRWQSVDLDQWKADIIYLRNNAGVANLEHGDDFPGSWERIKAMLHFLHNVGVRYRPSMRANQIDYEVAREMRALGVTHVSIGMETASPRMLKLIQKGITVAQQLTAARALAKYGIHPLYYFIIGMPTETQDDVNATLAMMDALNVIHDGKLTQNVYSYLPLPGTRLWELADKSKLPKTLSEWSNFSLNKTDNKLASSLYFIGGLKFHGSKGDKTDKNFPGLKRALIAPFEASANWRWKHREFRGYDVERICVETMIKWVGRHA